MEKKNNTITKQIYGKLISENYKIDSVDELCSLIGISKKTFYLAYSSKEQFVIELFKYFNDTTALALENYLESKNEPCIKIILLMQTLVFLGCKKEYIIECQIKSNEAIENLDEEFEIMFSNTLIKILENMNDKKFLIPDINYYLYAEVLIKFILDIVKQNKKNINEINKHLFIKYILVNSLKGICIPSQNEIIDKHTMELDKTLKML